MTCRIEETRLALYVEGDVTDEEARHLEAHLAGCERCRILAGDLETSQQALKAFASRPLDPEALALLRRRVLDSIDEEGPAFSRFSPGVWWGLAAAAAALLLGGLLLSRTGPASDPAPLPVAYVPAPVSTPLPTPTPTPAPQEAPKPLEREAAARPPAFPRSTLVPPPPVSRGEEPSVPVHRLSPEDADQLARALVAVSGIDELPRRPPEAAPTPAPKGTLVRLTTADPNVVVYWQLEPNGG